MSDILDNEAALLQIMKQDKRKSRVQQPAVVVLKPDQPVLKHVLKGVLKPGPRGEKFLVIDPTGNRQEIVNITGFCREQKLNRSNLLWSKSGSKGWTASRIKE